MKIKKFNEEFFGGAEGQVNINIDGDGQVKQVVINEIKKALKNIGGNINLLVDGEKVNIHNYGGGMG
jgi:hypothetical protein